MKTRAPSYFQLITVARVTRPEPEREKKAMVWLREHKVGAREKYILYQLWETLDNIHIWDETYKCEPLR